ncbi:MAG TPA: NAD-dependent epimerase/dehydratase family protein [Candidatus Paceibacterota bacterium]|nr:NAD-dependent epimerase/dehydratase family protein [Candidatus Paceibacterota bacterium]
MKPVLITGGCGFVGRHLVKGLLARGYREIWIVDNLSIASGHAPEEWLASWKKEPERGFTRFTKSGRTIVFHKADAIAFFHEQAAGTHPVELPAFGDIFHLASIVGGRALIDGDPLLVATDLGIDAAFFLWLSRFPDKAGRVLYASSSAAYPTRLQKSEGAVALAEHMIDFKADLGTPDMTYGWSKLTGEYLARLAHERYGVRIACVRPFSGFGEDQDLTYPTPSIALRIARGDDPIEVWGTGAQSRDFIHIDDCVDAFFAILDRISDGSGVNIGTGTITSFLDLIKKMLTVEKRSAKIRPLSDKPVGVANRYADTTRLAREIDWKPKLSLEEGLAMVLAGAHERLAGTELPFSLD